MKNRVNKITKLQQHEKQHRNNQTRTFRGELLKQKKSNKDKISN